VAALLAADVATHPRAVESGTLPEEKRVIASSHSSEDVERAGIASRRCCDRKVVVSRARRGEGAHRSLREVSEQRRRE